MIAEVSASWSPETTHDRSISRLSTGNRLRQLREERDEVVRRDRPPGWVIPAEQRLDAEDLAAGEPHERLVVQLELVPVLGVLQIRAELEPLDDALVHGRLEDAVAALAVPFSHVH